MAHQLDHEASLLEARLFGSQNTDTVDGEHYARTERLAAILVRRQTNQHDCREKSTRVPCSHPDHRRDMFYTHAMLEALGIPQDHLWPTQEDYDLYLRQEVKTDRHSSANRTPSKSTGLRSAHDWGYGTDGDRSNHGRFH